MNNINTGICKYLPDSHPRNSFTTSYSDIETAFLLVVNVDASAAAEVDWVVVAGGSGTSCGSGTSSGTSTEVDWVGVVTVDTAGVRVVDGISRLRLLATLEAVK